MSADYSLLVTYITASLGISFACSLLEGALLSVRVSELEQRKEAGDRGAAILLELKRDRIDDAISSILILGTISNTAGATFSGAEAADVFGDRWVGVFSAVLIFLVLVFSEIVPKMLGTAYAGRLAGVVGRTIRVLTFVMAPLLALTRLVTRLITRDQALSISRGELTALVAMAAREGAIHSQESVLFANVLALERVKVEDVMTPRTVAIMLPADATLGDLINDSRADSVSRIPIYVDNRDHVVGYVLQRDALLRAARGANLDTPLIELKREVTFIPQGASLSIALRRFLEQYEQLAMVVDEFGGVSGLVTLEDLVETVLGVEIVDESDRVADMRRLATELRDRRLARHRERLPGATAEQARRRSAAE